METPDLVSSSRPSISILKYKHLLSFPPLTYYSSDTLSQTKVYDWIRRLKVQQEEYRYFSPSLPVSLIIRLRGPDRPCGDTAVHSLIIFPFPHVFAFRLSAQHYLTNINLQLRLFSPLIQPQTSSSTISERSNTKCHPSCTSTHPSSTPPPPGPPPAPTSPPSSAAPPSARSPPGRASSPASRTTPRATASHSSIPLPEPLPSLSPAVAVTPPAVAPPFPDRQKTPSQTTPLSHKKRLSHPSTPSATAPSPYQNTSP